MPHYATMSRATDCYYKQDSLDSGNGRSVKYTSQPQLNGNGHDDYLSNRTSYATDILTPLSIRTSITFPRKNQEKVNHGGLPLNVL